MRKSLPINRTNSHCLREFRNAKTQSFPSRWEWRDNWIVVRLGFHVLALKTI